MKTCDTNPTTATVTSPNPSKKPPRCSKVGVIASSILAIAALSASGYFYTQWTDEVSAHESESVRLRGEIQSLQIQHTATKSKVQATQSSLTQAKIAQKLAEKREAGNQKQLIALGIANDHLMEWMMTNHNPTLPELQTSTTARDALARELETFLKSSDTTPSYQVLRARIILNLAEIALNQKNPSKAALLLDTADKAWAVVVSNGEITTQAARSHHVYRITRDRLICALQAQNQQNTKLAAQLLPQVKTAMESIHAAQSFKTDTSKADVSSNHLKIQHLKSAFLILQGRMLQTSDPASALKKFTTAIEMVKTIATSLPDHIAVRSELTRYRLEAANLADAISQVDDAKRHRSEAVVSLEALLKAHPELKLPKIQLAEIKLISASNDIGEGNDSAGATTLAEAEKLLASIPSDEHAPLNGATLQLATAKGLRSILLRDAGKRTAAKQNLEEAIQMVDPIVQAQDKTQITPSITTTKKEDTTTTAPVDAASLTPATSSETIPAVDPNEARYRLAVLHWQLAGLIGDGGDQRAELRQGKKAADLMSDLLQNNPGKRDNAIRRGLAYLYGDLAYTASKIGGKRAASNYYQLAATTWQSLITKYGKQQEYTDGLKWSQSRAREVTPK